MKFFASIVALCGVASSLAVNLDLAGGSLVKHTGTPVGYEKQYDGINLYISRPLLYHSDVAVLFITDVFGIQLNENRLLADSFARAGYLTVAPDLFDGSPAPADLTDPNFDLTAFLTKYNEGVTDPKLENVINTMKTKLGVKQVVATGYCYGGRYAFRFGSEGRGVEVIYAAHPSLLTDDEVSAVAHPVSLATAENDQFFPTERRIAVEQLLKAAPQPYHIATYSGTEHGFGSRANVSDPEGKFAKETAFAQAVNHFKYWAPLQ